MWTGLYMSLLLGVLSCESATVKKVDFQNNNIIRVLQKSGSDDVITVFEPTSFGTFLKQFGKHMGNKRVGDEVPEGHRLTFDNEGSDDVISETGRFQLFCDRMKPSYAVNRRVRRTTGRFPAVVKQLQEACRRFFEYPSKENIERIEDMDEEMTREVICLTRGVTFGLSSECQSEFKAGHTSLLDQDEALDSDPIPSIEKIQTFNRAIERHCKERLTEDHIRKRRSIKGIDHAHLAEKVLDFLDCMCDNRTDCGHLGYAAAKSFQENLGKPIADAIENGLSQSEIYESEAEKYELLANEELLVPENITFEKAWEKVTHSKLSSKRQKRSIEAADVALAAFRMATGCDISINKTMQKQKFSCTLHKVLRLGFSMRWKPQFRMDIDASVCVPYIGKVIEVLSSFPTIDSFFDGAHTTNGCMSFARASADFYQGIFESSVGPQFNFIALRAWIDAGFMYRFDTEKPVDDWRKRKALNLFGDSKYIRAKVRVKVEHCEFWNLIWTRWKCLYCKTLVDRKWKL